MTAEIGADILDSRDVDERIEELESAIADGDLGVLDYDTELDELRDLRKQAQDYTSEWRYGVTLILDDYFVEYAQQMAEDIGATPREHTWPLSYIDWDRAADALKQDYTSIEIAGHEYWVRS